MSPGPWVHHAARRSPPFGAFLRAAAGVLALAAAAGPAPTQASRPATQPASTKDLLDRFADKQATPQDRVEAAEGLLAAGPAGARQLLPVLSARLRFEQGAYRRDFQTRATALRVATLDEAARAQNKTPAQINLDIREWRKAVLSLHERPGLSPQMIRSQAEGALAKLNALLYVDPQTVLKRSAELAERRRELLVLEALRVRCVSAVGGQGAGPSSPASQPADPRQTFAGALADFEDLACLLAMPMVEGARGILLSNVKKEAQLRPPEAGGIRDVNRIRMLLGQWVLQTDLRLCACARAHCLAMQKYHFFGHVSPVPGQRQPWDRAKLFGTQAGAENITAGPGLNDYKQANQNWFQSPHHFNNLFHKFRFIGLGFDNGYWTQMFGW